jgi:hypothetical protein
MKIPVCVLSIAAVCRCVSGQTQLETLREVKLPVLASRGKFGSSFLVPGTPAWEYVSIKAAPDQSLLVYDSNATGKWPLFRVKKWWTKDPVSEALDIPGWTAADTKYLGEMYIDLQITPDGRYAVVFAGANWLEKSDGLPLLFPPHYIAHKPDTILTVVDLERWQIAGSIHTASLEDADFRGARILNGDLIALQGLSVRPRPDDWVYNRVNRLISIPDLKPGPGCVTKRSPEANAEARKRNAEALSRRNDAACADVLKVSGAKSMTVLETIIHTGHGLEPAVLAEEKDFDEHWNQRDPWPFEAAPFESSSHTWYRLHVSHENNSVHSELAIFDADGRKLKSQAIPHLLCDIPKNLGGALSCSCRIENGSEEQHILLAYCRTQRDQVAGSKWMKQWLSVFRSDDLSEVGYTNLSSQKETSETIATVDGRAYALTVELGETLRVFAVPGRP